MVELERERPPRLLLLRPKTSSPFLRRQRTVTTTRESISAAHFRSRRFGYLEREMGKSRVMLKNIRKRTKIFFQNQYIWLC